MTNRAPLIVAIVLLLLPVVHVGSYLALVVPEGCHPNGPRIKVSLDTLEAWPEHYRTSPRVCEVLFYPLEKVDRIVQPGAWDGPFSTGGYLY